MTPLRVPLHCPTRAMLMAAGLVLLTAALPLAQAAPSSDEPAASTPADPLIKVRELLNKKQWAGATSELRRINATRSADWHNLMGYSLRKAATPDLAGAERHYNEALRISPQHRGALEYAGELALMQGNLPLAQQREAALVRACNGACEELSDLQAALVRYKASGNRHVPKG